jgi:serine/threonine-protein kinase
MAPEQVRGKRGDDRTDIYALGTILYEMVTGEMPYVASNVHTMMRTKLNQDPRPPREVYPSLDPKIEEIILRAIERSPRERYSSAKDLLADLEDPSRVVPRDRSARGNVPLFERIHVPRRLLMPTILVLVVGSLIFLTLTTGRSHGARDRTQPPSSAPASGR